MHVEESWGEEDVVEHRQNQLKPKVLDNFQHGMDAVEGYVMQKER